MSPTLGYAGLIPFTQIGLTAVRGTRDADIRPLFNEAKGANIEVRGERGAHEGALSVHTRFKMYSMQMKPSSSQ